MLQTKFPSLDTVTVRPHPQDGGGKVDPALEIEMVRLGRGAIAMLQPGRPRVIQVTGAGRGVGTSRIVMALGDALARSGTRTGSFDLTMPQPSEPDLPPMRVPRADPAVHGGEPVPYSDPAFDILLLDTPPMRLSGVAMTLAHSVGGTVLVVEAERTTRHEIQESLHLIEDCGGHCLGLVLNRRRRRFWRRGR